VERLQAVGNVSARTLRAKELVANDLANNIAHAFRWHDATTILKELGCSLFLEMPPGHVPSDLATENISGINSIPVDPAVLLRVLRPVERRGSQFLLIGWSAAFTSLQLGIRGKRRSIP
jgi:malonyl CoA-acyl carrier protein transacylase